MRQRVQAARLVAGDDGARSLETAPDGDLAGAGGVEPGDGLVGADVLGSLAPQPLQFALAELTAARPGGGHHAHAERGVLVVGPAEPGVVEREIRRGHREVREPVGLYEVTFFHERHRVEAPDLTGDPKRQMFAAFASDAVEDVYPFQRHLPERFRGRAVGGDDTNARDDGAPGLSDVHRVLPPVLVRATADWKPPKPLPTDSTLRSFMGRAVRGT